jgi:tetratricopeptide (TPR) repeat protein
MSQADGGVESVERETQISIEQNVGEIANGGRATALEIKQHKGSLTLQMFGTKGGDIRRFHAPPTARRTLVGRERELVQVAAEVEGRRRTLIYGMPGIGKTALASAVVNQLHNNRVFKKGILWVNEIRNGSIESVCDAIARRLGDQEAPRLPPHEKPDATRDLLESHKDLLVVLDYLDSAKTAQMLSEFVIPEDSGLLITSRMHHPVSDVDVHIGPLVPDSAIELFRRAARIGNRGDGIVADICDLLGFHPLALWIAASRIRIEGMSLARLKQRLEEETTRLKSLRLGNGEDKNRSVWISLNMSYERLNQAQRRVIARLAACFDCTVSLGLLASVCNLPSLDCEDNIGLLVAQSLVDRSEDRLSLQPLVRDFARDVLGDRLPEVQDEIVAAVRMYVADHGDKNSAHYDALESEVGNLIGTVHYAASREDWKTVLEVGKALGLPVSGVLAVRGYWSELLALDQLGIEAAEKRGAVQTMTRFKHSAASILQSRGDYELSGRLYKENLAVFEEQRDELAEAMTLHNLGVIAWEQGDYEEARTFLNQSRALKERSGYDRYLASTLHQLGLLAEDQSNLETATSLYNESCKLDEEFQNPVGRAVNRQQMAVVQQLQGNVEEAHDLLQESLDIYKLFSDRARIATAQRCLGRLMYEQGEYDTALDLLTESLKTARSLHARPLVVQTLYDVGVLAQEKGEFQEARSSFVESLQGATALGAAKHIAYCQYRLGALAREKGEYTEARHLCNRGKVIFEKLGMRLGIADCLHELGHLAQAQDQPDEAEEYYRHSLQIRNAVGHKLGIAHSQHALGELAQARNHIGEAREHFRKSLELYTASGAPRAAVARRRLQSLESGTA